MTPRYELRVLKGLHSEARCAIQDGAAVGSDLANDIVLSDEGILPYVGRIRLREDGWYLSADDTLDEHERTINAWNSPLPIGLAWITVAQDDAPWIYPDHNQYAEVSDVRPPSQVAAPSSGSDGINNNAVALPGLGTETRWRTWSTMVLAVAIALVILSAIALATVSNGTSTPNASLSPGADQPLGQISAALQRLGLTSSLHVTLSKSGTATVSGWVKDQEQYEAVASAMSQIWPMPAIRISLESEAILTARAILQRYSVKFDPLYQGNGRLEIVGIAASARERAAALDAVRAQLPGLVVVGSSIELAQEVSDQFAETLINLGISGVTLTWQPGHLEVQPPELDDAQEALLVDAIEEFNKRHWNLAQLGDAPAAVTASSVPFGIRSVIGGPQPFIVLADGSKLLVGGTYNRYRLIAIEDSRIIFDGPRRAIVTR